MVEMFRGGESFRRILSEIMLMLILSGTFLLSFHIRPIKAAGLIYIMADGSIDPPTAPISTTDNVTYTFVDDIYASIIVLRSSIIVDGTGHLLHGTGTEYGFDLYDAYNVTIHNSKIENFLGGICLSTNSCHNTIIKNEVTSSIHGIELHGNSDENRIYENNITDNLIGVWLCWASNNVVYHNNIVGNGISVTSENYPNTLDHGYPSGGNHWSDYEGVDVRKGPSQNQPGSDGIGDAPYIIDDNNRDRYPLMNPFGGPQPPIYTLTIASGGNGTSSPAPGTYTYTEGQNVSVRAIPYTGYILDHWELDGINAGEANPINVTMNTDHELCALFTMVCTLTITVTTGGTTNPAAGNHTYAVGTTIIVVAIANNGYFFHHWEVDNVNNSTNPITIKMDADHTLKAVFAITKYTLIVASSTGGITDPLPGTYTYPAGTVVGVNALPDAGYYLDHWELDNIDIGPCSPANVTMNENHTLNAVFRQLSSGHDVTIKSITSKTVVGQGYPLNVRVITMNIGSYTETFNVTTYVDTTIIGTIMNVTLTSGAHIALTFTWNTAGFTKGNYTISAYVWPVSNETDIVDNMFTGGWATVAMVGDLTGSTSDPWDFVPDGMVDGADLIVACRCFGSWPEACSPLIWNPNCDINNDSIVDGADIIIVSRHYGETDP